MSLKFGMNACITVSTFVGVGTLLAGPTSSRFDSLGISQNPIIAVNDVKTTAARDSQQGEMVFLTVDKTKLTAELRTRPEHFADGKTVDKFRIAIGKEKGDKQKIGDNRTPEGIYMTQEILHDDELPPKYGPKAIPLDYPNPLDKVAGKTGYGIWLHGVIEDKRVEEANVTEGCVAFYNADIIKLTNWLKPHQGIVVISDRGEDVNRPEDVAAVEAKTNAWIEDWASRDLDRYLSHYSEDFEGGGMDIDAYRNYKKAVFRTYKVMNLTMSNIRVLTHPKYAVSFMDQDFYGDNRFKSIGRKIVYWTKSKDNQWRISREVYENRRFEFVRVSAVEESLAKSRTSKAESARNGDDPEQDNPKL